jgi:hypothetical protein
MIKKNRIFLITLAVTLVLYWTLICLSANYEWARAVCAVVLFPFAPFQMFFEHYCLSLNDPTFTLPINDEITGGLLFLLSVIGQTAVYYWLYKKCVAFFKEYRQKN